MECICETVPSFLARVGFGWIGVWRLVSECFYFALGFLGSVTVFKFMPSFEYIESFTALKTLSPINSRLTSP